MSQYVLTDGTRFIYRNYQNKFVPTNSEAMADIYSRKQANGILSNSLPKPLRSVFHVEKYDKPVFGIKQVDDATIKANTEKTIYAENIQYWVEKMADMNGIVKEAKSRKKVLEKQLKELDSERLDIAHYIEFQKLNAAQGYKASREFKECSIKRRNVKNELAVLDIILDQKSRDVAVNELKEKIKQLDDRTYKPRVRKDLFDL